jgi:hypothetical protein
MLNELMDERSQYARIGFFFNELSRALGKSATYPTFSNHDDLLD